MWWPMKWFLRGQNATPARSAAVRWTPAAVLSLKDIPSLAQAEGGSRSPTLVVHQVRKATAAIKTPPRAALICPPEGRGKAVLYSTSLRAVRKTFVGSGTVRVLLESSGAHFSDRDVSVHKGFKEELRALLGPGSVPPVLFLDGKHIGGADQVLRLHQRGRLMPLLDHLPRDPTAGEPCPSCADEKFCICRRCNGAHKLYNQDAQQWDTCSFCNERGSFFAPPALLIKKHPLIANAFFEKCLGFIAHCIEVKSNAGERRKGICCCGSSDKLML